MKDRTVSLAAVQPRDVHRFLTGLAATEAFRDPRTPWQRVRGLPRFDWQTGELTAEGRQYVYVHLTGWPTRLLHEALAGLKAAFVVHRAESGFLDKWNHNPIMVILISGRRGG